MIHDRKFRKLVSHAPKNIKDSSLGKQCILELKTAGLVWLGLLNVETSLKPRILFFNEAQLLSKQFETNRPYKNKWKMNGETNFAIILIGKDYSSTDNLMLWDTSWLNSLAFQHYGNLCTYTYASSAKINVRIIFLKNP